MIEAMTSYLNLSLEDKMKLAKDAGTMDIKSIQHKLVINVY